jgi:hypothetical protein
MNQIVFEREWWQPNWNNILPFARTDLGKPLETVRLANASLSGLSLFVEWIIFNINYVSFCNFNLSPDFSFLN